MARRSISSPRAEAGFALIEVVAMLAIIALLAAITLPALPRATSRAKLESLAVETAALLKADRAAALRRRVAVSTGIDVSRRRVNAGASARSVTMPADVTLDALLAARCAGQAAQAIAFFASGASCGGVLTLARPGIAYEVRVNWLTGGVEIVAQQTG